MTPFAKTQMHLVKHEPQVLFLWEVKAFTFFFQYLFSRGRNGAVTSYYNDNLMDFGQNFERNRFKIKLGSV